MSRRADRACLRIVLLGLACCAVWILAGCGSGVATPGGTLTTPTVVPDDVVDGSVATEPETPTDTASETPTRETPPPRENISDFVQDPTKVAAYRQALEIMRRNGAADPSSVEFRTSLTFWANTHGYFGNSSGATSFPATVQRRLPQCLQYFQSSPYRLSAADAQTTCGRYYTAASQEFTPDAFADGIWGTCQHTTDAVRQTPRFLPWHRLYLYYFERTLRKYSGSDAFALPYWDYFDYPADGAPGGNLWLPPLVTDGGSTVANTFYDELRTLWLNDRRTSISPASASAKDAFALHRFVEFSNELEGLPHGNMHCATGNGCTAPHIGWVPVAGNDPLFYMHHANIDRLWQCWMNRESGGAPIDLAWAKANLGMPDSWYDIAYAFADENGNRITKTIADAFAPEVAAVRYAQEVDCRIDWDATSDSLPTPRFAAVDDGIEQADKVLMSGKLDLATRSMRVALEPETERLQSRQPSARTLLESDGGASSGVWLLLENIVIKEAPAYTYNVYLASKSRPEERALVTRFQFFGFGDHGAHGDHGDHGAHGAHGDGEHRDADSEHDGAISWGTRRFYVSDDISELDITDMDDLDVYFVPTHAVTGEVLDEEEGESLISIESVRLITLQGSD